MVEDFFRYAEHPKTNLPWKRGLLTKDPALPGIVAAIQEGQSINVRQEGRALHLLQHHTVIAEKRVVFREGSRIVRVGLLTSADVSLDALRKCLRRDLEAKSKLDVDVVAVISPSKNRENVTMNVFTERFSNIWDLFPGNVHRGSSKSIQLTVKPHELLAFFGEAL